MIDQTGPAPAGRTGNAVTDDEPVIELSDVYKSFGPLDVLCGVDLKLRRGESTVIIGESAAGKSVVLKHIVGLLKPDRGEVRYQGRLIGRMGARELAEVRMSFGFLFQLGALFDSLTVEENVAFPIVEHARRSRAEIEGIVAGKLRMVGLDGIQHKRPADLSGGQRKRVALARAIALDPEIILYDEPTTGLDPPRADVINELILKLKRETAVTGIVVTHDMTSALKVGDRIVMLYEGKFICDEKPAGIVKSKDAPVRQFVEGRASEDDLRSLNQRS
ncbi:MAG: ABC transporter ATP-binding protein [Planctomycetota bacterium]|jgi:phospholipid/cholesterol/gamma-HCH transport system ATP-binding protein